jgi:DNA polymerase-3 subunit delta
VLFRSRVASLVGQDAGMLAMEAEKLCLYVGERATITVADVTELVGLSREEKVFAAVDAAGAGRVSEALTIWHDVLATDRAAAFKAVGGIAYKLRVYLAAQRLAGEGQPARAIAPKVQMWGRERELEVILRRLSLERLMALLAALAELDSQAKVGARSIETGVESFLVQVACAAA